MAEALILVIGATGLLGQALLRSGRLRGMAMIGAARHGAEVVCDIRDEQQVADLISKLRPQGIINTAALTDLTACEQQPLEAYRINAQGVYFLADAARTHGCRLVHISTDHFFSDDIALHAEDARVALLNEYARSKYAGEAFAATCPGALILRTNITGFRGWPGKPTFAEWMFQVIETDQEVGLFDDFVTSTLDAKSMALATLQLMQSSAAGVLNVASRQASSKKQFVEAVAQQLGKRLTRSRGDSVKSLRPRRAASLGLNVGAAQAILGSPLPALQEVAVSLVREYHEQCAIKHPS